MPRIDPIAELEALRATARSHGGDCLSVSFLGSKQNHRWRCKEGHVWESTPNGIKRGRWCPVCAGFKLWAPGLTEEEARLEEYRLLASNKGGELLSTAYKGNKVKLRWRCTNGHVWEATPNQIKNGHWCRFCAGQRLWVPGVDEAIARLEECRSLAMAKGGQCLSAAYLGNNYELQWRCADGHEWEVSPHAIKSDNWCPFCAKKQFWLPGKNHNEAGLEECRSHAASKGGLCLAETYTNRFTKVLWRCSNLHEWEANPGNVIAGGTWCPYCSGVLIWSPGHNQAEARLLECQLFAEAKGGLCLSTMYLGNNKVLRWRCVDGHEWEANPNNIKSGWWCPTCSASIGEEMCRRIIERLTDTPWPRIRPRWLLNSRGQRMEIDGYSKRFNAGFEYQGEQHYSYVSMFHATEADLTVRKGDDDRKRELCRLHEIRLIEVPHTVPKESLITYLVASLAEMLNRVIEVPVGLTMESLGSDPGRLAELEAIARRKGGELLSTTYLGMLAKHRWRCADGHEWAAVPSSIRSGRWCPFCKGRRIWSPGLSQQEARLQECRTLAEARGGHCLSAEYVYSDTKLLWTCSVGHEWEAPASRIKRGSWCPTCARKRQGRRPMPFP